jgi:UDP-N-acetylglucosamine--N-acetylmuramyl-(pentapeptide) pyrophosphoryl-undecaprenol N-acetylglucosamine transferase
MNRPVQSYPHVAIACGGTGGHLFPGIAVGREVLARGGRVTLYISEKEVDRQAVAAINDLSVVALPSVGLTKGRWLAFLAGVLRSRRLAREQFRKDPPQVVLAMGGFTSAGPVLAGRSVGAKCFLHDSNFIPGRANRWLARVADGVFVAFLEAQARFKVPSEVTGTPVRLEFHTVNSTSAREALGLRPDDPVLLVMGGSQGAAGINRLLVEALPCLVERLPRLQYVHLTGATDLEAVQSAYHRLGVKALVRIFCADMHHALGAATLAVSRAGGSSLAEIAATRTPAVLIPYPAAADQHQQFNAAALAGSGAARVVAENSISGAAFGGLLAGMLEDAAALAAMHERLANWQPLDAAARIVDAIFTRLPVKQEASTIHATATTAGARPPSSTLNPLHSAAS